MGRGVAFTYSEDSFIVDNGEHKTANELYVLHREIREEKVWPRRSIKSLARRIERLRLDSRLDIRDDETRRKAYYGRHKPKE